MRILLAHNSLYYPSLGGGDKSNRLLMEALAARGHQVRVVARVENFGPPAQELLLAQLAARKIEPKSSSGAAVEFTHNNVEVDVLTLNPQLRGYFEEQIAAFDPDLILTSTDDPAQLLLEIALRASRARVVHLVRATIAVPFGPDSSMASAARTELLHKVDGIVGVSEYVARYVREFGGVEAVHVPISLMESGEVPYLGKFENPFVSMVNPCAVKGICILLALAGQMPEVRFAAVPVWGTNSEDLAALRQHSNITLLPPAENIDGLLRQTRVLLVPSLWAEARSRMIPEAMLRGIPVLASNIGGIPEAMLGMDYLLPVNPIQHYKPAVDEHMVPIAEVPAQNIRPWQQALENLNDSTQYTALSLDSRQAALAYADTLSVRPFEAYLDSVIRKPQRDRGAKATPLSADKRKLLALRLKKTATDKNPEHLWFENTEAPGLRLFCFPSAGGGTALYRPWADLLKPEVAACPVRLPGRESRLAEPAIDSMNLLIAALVSEIVPFLHRPFAFFGHSMGAAIAFELTRALRRGGHPQPRALFVSAARAPQFRLGHEPQPDPTDEALLQELGRLDGVPAEVWSNPTLLQMALPALRADTRLYRNYVYVPEPPLTVPIYACGGAIDTNVSPEHIGAWAQQTSARFEEYLFPGGHFYLQSARPDLLKVLRIALSDFT